MVERRKSNTNPQDHQVKDFLLLNDQMVTRHDDSTQNAFGLGQPSHLLALCPDKGPRQGARITGQTIFVFATPMSLADRTVSERQEKDKH
jgi:hypothetical protein